VQRIPFYFLIVFLFAALLRAREEMFRSTIAGPDGACRQFWEAIRDTAFVAIHPALPENMWQRIVPRGLHADAGAFSHQDSLYTISWNNLVGTGQTLTKRFLFTVLRKSEMSEDTLDAALRIMSWSFNILIEGVTPSVDWVGRPLRGGGQPLAGSWRGALCQVRGDWAFFKECFHFPPVEWCSTHVLDVSGFLCHREPPLDELQGQCWMAPDVVD